jgi:hypothetical protein
MSMAGVLPRPASACKAATVGSGAAPHEGAAIGRAVLRANDVVLPAQRHAHLVSALPYFSDAAPGPILPP